MSSAEDSKPVQKKPMGVGALVRRSTVAKEATAEMKAAAQRPPAGLTDTAAQSFYGDKQATKAQAKPLQYNAAREPCGSNVLEIAVICSAILKH